MDPVVVVGGGIVGTSVAAHFAEAGLPVACYERDSLGGGTTAASVAMFVWHQSSPDPTAHALRERSWETYGPLVEAGTLDFDRIGGLYLEERPETCETHRTTASDLESLGVRTELLAPADLERFGLATDHLHGALSVPDEGYLDPNEVVQHFVGEVRDAGGTVETGAAVTDVVVEGGRAVGVDVEGDRVDASAVVNAAGPWAPAVDAMAGVSHPLRNNRGQILVLDHGTDPPLPFVEFEDGHYVRGEGTRQVFAGGYGARYEDAARLDPDAARSVDESFSLAAVERFERFLPALVDARVATDWVGLRTITPDGNPLVGATDREGYYVATGLSGLGVTLAPAVGSVLADVVAPDRECDPAVRAFLSPTRFG
ncbi:NAD(P)/FAD-dependent oxidoreductase [Halomarina litorea]|uniref:NAD(P)/FAD-dependent oxidoreductase n=1 Tax=Halomarina litorea TaxID=2961595 RepID=UPI0020C387B5|nr:FAD-dependent oxidoreductase [Halomarina sp. BCD28]